MTTTGTTRSAGPAVRVLTEAQVRTLLPPAEALDVVREAMIAQARGKVSKPAPWHLEVPAADASVHGEVHVKGAYVHDASHYTVKLATGFFGNRELGIPVSSGLSVIADATTGFPTVIALDNGYLTDVRTGAAGALAAQVLSRIDSHRVALIGPGHQADYQLRALLQVRNPRELVVHGRDRARAKAFARRAQALHSWEVQVAADSEEAVRRADIIITVTPSRAPYLHGEWIKPGAHITAVGSDMEGKQELHLSALRRAAVVAADDPDQCLHIGELQHAAKVGITDTLNIEALGDVLAGLHPGRSSETEITIADLTGLGAQDAAMGARLATALMECSRSTAGTGNGAAGSVI